MNLGNQELTVMVLGHTQYTPYLVTLHLQ